MKKNEKKPNEVTDEMLSQMFIDYVSIMEDKERHTKKACEEVDAFDKYCEEVFPGDVRKQTEAYNKMMDVAVDFEESGFIAGAKWILNLLNEQETAEIIRTQNPS